MMGSSALPLVITVSKPTGYEGSFTHYSKEELYSIVKDAKDLSLPDVTEEVKTLGIVTEEANTELVERGRTMSIDQALRGRAPRTWSVDSIDYTSLSQEILVKKVRICASEEDIRRRSIRLVFVLSTFHSAAS